MLKGMRLLHGVAVFALHGHILSSHGGDLQVKVQYSDPAGTFLHTSSAKQVSVVLRHGYKPGTAEIEIELPKVVRHAACYCRC